MNSIAHQEPHAESINPADNKTLTVFRKDESMEICREYGIPPYKVIVLHGGPGAPGCAAGLCRILEEDIDVLKHLQKACTIDGFMDEILYLIRIYALSQIILAGHSFGAWLALLFADKYHLLVSRAIIIGCGPLKAKYLPEIIQTQRSGPNRGFPIWIIIIHYLKPIRTCCNLMRNSIRH